MRLVSRNAASCSPDSRGRVAFDNNDGDGGALQPAGIGAAAQLEAAQVIGDGAAQRVVESKRRHAAGLVKVQTTAGGTLRQMRLPCAPARCRRSRNGARHGRLGPVGELHQGGAARQGLEHAADDAVHDLGRQRQQRQARHDRGDRCDAVIGEQAWQPRGVALDDARTGEMAAQEGGELRIALDQHESTAAPMPAASSALVTSPVPAPSSTTWPGRPSITDRVVQAIASASNRPLGTTAPVAKGRRSQRFRNRAVPAGSTVGMAKR